MRTVSRRGFLGMLAAVGAAIGVFLFRGRRTRTLASELETVLEHNASTMMIGRQYLRRVPDEADPDRLRELILATFGWAPMFQGDVRVLIRERVKSDFAEDRVVRLGQWMLSETEARLCALTTLVNRTERVG